ncbi:hypothetical protein MBRA_05225 [Methylobacterium brachiatum]|nr:hypothetical protein MBRA_05225 [Methylobacterium brachiatum]
MSAPTLLPRWTMATRRHRARGRIVWSATAAGPVAEDVLIDAGVPVFQRGSDAKAMIEAMASRCPYPGRREDGGRSSMRGRIHAAEIFALDQCSIAGRT